MMNETIGKQIIEIRTAAGGLVGPLVRLVLILALGFVVLQLARCDAARERDQYWREQIEKGSQHVTRIMEKAGRTLPVADRRRLDELERENATQRNELEALRRQREAAPLSDPCRLCRIPSERLRVNSGGGQAGHPARR